LRCERVLDRRGVEHLTLVARFRFLYQGVEISLPFHRDRNNARGEQWVLLAEGDRASGVERSAIDGKVVYGLGVR